MARARFCAQGASVKRIPFRRRSIFVSASQSFELSLEFAASLRVKDAKLNNELLAHPAFSYAVRPNLSAPSSWKAMLRWNKNSESSSNNVAARPSARLVETLPVNLRSQTQLKHIVQDVYRSTQPQAMLCVSGNHPVRRLPVINRCLPSSVDLIKIASLLRARGDMEQSVQLWGVGNPVVERDATRLELKAAAGAEAILTQPPLDWKNFERWMHDVRKRGVDEQCRVLVGIPLLTSAAHLKFWISLCGADVQGEPENLLHQWMAAEQEMSEYEFHSFRIEWNRRLIQEIRKIPGVSGLHAMPFSGQGRSMALQFLNDGTLQGTRSMQKGT